MLSAEQTIERLHALALKFDEYYFAKEGLKAMCVYRQAVTIATFMKINSEEMRTLFGDREMNKDGLFKYERVMKAHELAFRQEKEHYLAKDRPVDCFGIRYIHI